MMKGFSGERSRVLIVDGYNVINVRKPVRESRGLEDARRKLTDRLHDYAGWSGQRIVLVYDAWLSDRAQRSVEQRGTLEIVFTKKGETADQYIERLCDELSEDVEMRRIELRVATSDLVEQTIAFGRGATRVSSRELLMEMDAANALRGSRVGSPGPRGITVAERLPPDIRERLERMRRGEELPQRATKPDRLESEPKPERSEASARPEQGESTLGPERGEAKPEVKRRGPETKAKQGVAKPAPDQRGSAVKSEPKPDQVKPKSRSGKNRTRRKPKPNPAPDRREADQGPAPAPPKPTGRQSKDRSKTRQTTPSTPPPNRKDAHH